MTLHLLEWLNGPLQFALLFMEILWINHFSLVCVSVLSVCPTVFPSVHALVCLSIHLYVCLPAVCLSLSLNLSIYFCHCLSICRYVARCIFVYLSVRLFIKRFNRRKLLFQSNLGKTVIQALIYPMLSDGHHSDRHLLDSLYLCIRL